MAVFFALMIGHFLCDYPLQGDFLARAKAPGGVVAVPWYQAMTAHCAIHAGSVWLITHSWQLAVLEFIAHFLIDRMKTDGMTTLNQDQALHAICKAAWSFMLVTL